MSNDKPDVKVDVYSDDLKIEVLPDVQAQIDADPKLAKIVADLNAAFHQAFHGVKTGQYKTLDEGVEAITGGKMTRVTDNGDDN